MAELMWSARELAGPAPAGAPAWLPAAYRAWAAVLDRPGYPCHFGVRGQRDGTTRFTVADRDGPDRLARALLRFQDLAATGPTRQSLVAFAGPPEPTARLADHHAAFWTLLAELRRRDPLPWPADVPADPADPRWQWSFGGHAWFVFAGSPAYRARRSRDLGPCLTLVFQTPRVFAGLGGATPAGQAAKQRIRAALTGYDRTPPHPHLGDPRRSSVHKWRQYALPDDGTELPPAGCPYGED